MELAQPRRSGSRFRLRCRISRQDSRRWIPLLPKRLPSLTLERHRFPRPPHFTRQYHHLSHWRIWQQSLHSVSQGVPCSQAHQLVANYANYLLQCESLFTSLFTELSLLISADCRSSSSVSLAFSTRRSSPYSISFLSPFGECRSSADSSTPATIRPSRRKHNVSENTLPPPWTTGLSWFLEFGQIPTFGRSTASDHLS